MEHESPEQELERRRLVERVEQSLRFRYAVIGAIVIAGAGYVITNLVANFTRDAQNRLNSAESKLVAAESAQQHAIGFLEEGLQRAGDALANAQAAQKVATDATEAATEAAQAARDVQDIVKRAQSATNKVEDRVELAMQTLETFERRAEEVALRNLELVAALRDELSQLGQVVQSLASRIDETEGINDRLSSLNIRLDEVDREIGETKSFARRNPGIETRLSRSALLESEVYVEPGQMPVAEVVDLVRRRDSGEAYVVLSVGGFLGIGGKKVALPSSDLSLEGGKIILPDAMQLEQMSDYDPSNYRSIEG